MTNYILSLDCGLSVQVCIMPSILISVVCGGLLIRAFELTGLCLLATPVYQMCGAAVEPVGTGGER